LLPNQTSVLAPTFENGANLGPSVSKFTFDANSGHLICGMSPNEKYDKYPSEEQITWPDHPLWLV
jgi:hypothetical protein